MPLLTMVVVAVMSLCKVFVMISSVCEIFHNFVLAKASKPLFLIVNYM